MSIHYGTYVGPYVSCAVAQVEVEKQRNTCPNGGCANHMRVLRDEVCGLCGARVRSVTYKEMSEAIDQQDVRKEINERLINPGGNSYSFWAKEQRTHIWLPNGDLPGRDFHLDQTNWNLIEITPLQAENEVAKLAELYSADLDVLRKHYGAIILHWGVIQDYT